MFFRVAVRLIEIPPVAKESVLGDGGAEVFGYSELFERELSKFGQLTLQEFESLYPTPENYVSRIGFDPTAARYWDLFNIPPEQLPPSTQPKSGQRLFDFR